MEKKKGENSENKGERGRKDKRSTVRESERYLPCGIPRRTHTDRSRTRQFEARQGEKLGVSIQHAELHLPATYRCLSASQLK